MMQKKILVPLGSSGTDFKSVHYALALAERMNARVYVLQLAEPDNTDKPNSPWLSEVLRDLINTARQAGLTVSHLMVREAPKNEIIEFVRTQGIDLLVFSADDRQCERLMSEIRAMISSQIIQVKEKDHVDYLLRGTSKKAADKEI